MEIKDTTLADFVSGVIDGICDLCGLALGLTLELVDSVRYFFTLDGFSNLWFDYVINF